MYGLPNDLADLFQPAYDAGARIHTNSWGAPVGGSYTQSSRQLDEFMWNNRDFIVLMSAGNNGRDTNSNGVIDDDSIGSPGTAKNCVTVGASESNRPNGSTPTPGLDGNWADFWPNRYSQMTSSGHVSDNPAGMAAFSSRGPTDDGRIKPDVVAPGTNVLSARTSEVPNGTLLWGAMEPTDPLVGLYCWRGPHSMRCPLLAATPPLPPQQLVDERGHHVDGISPSGALIKAILVNGSVPLGGQFVGEVPSGANSVSGFGLVQIHNSIGRGDTGQIEFSDDPSLAVSSGQMRRFSITASNGTSPAKITLCWTDAPSQAGQFGGGITNELYLQVRLADGTVINGDTVAFPNVANNVHQIIVENPGTDPIEVRVRGVQVTEQSPHSNPNQNAPTQDFAVAVSNATQLQEL